MDGRHTWSRADIERLMRLRLQHSLAELAREFGTTKNAVGAVIGRERHGAGSSEPFRMTRRKPKYQSALSLREHPLLGLKDDCCHWPLGNPAVPQRPYCAHHLRIGRQ